MDSDHGGHRDHYKGNRQHGSHLQPEREIAQLRVIRFTLSPGAAGTWDGLQFLDTMQDNRLTWAVIEYGGTTANNGMVGLTGSNLLIDHVYFDHTDRRRVRVENSSLVVRNSEFSDIFPGDLAPTTNNLSEHIWGNGIAPGGQLIIENNVFGAVKGHNDAIDLGGAQRPGPVPRIVGNLFRGGGDDALDLECDAHIEGNTFLHFHKDAFNTDPGNGNVISAGGGRDYTVVRNTFYDVDHAVLVKDGAFLTFENNTVVNSTDAAIYFDLAGQTNGPGRGAAVDSSIFSGVAAAFGDVLPTTQLTVNRSVVPAADVPRGVSNSSEDPRLKDPAALDFSLRPGSPALGTGANGLDMGAMAAGGASIGGGPAAVTGRAAATFTVGGPGITHYRYRLDGGAWSAELPVGTPIGLTGLSGATHTLRVVGKDSAGAWQPESAAATRTWTVNPNAALRVNEVLALSTTGPDLIELHNDGDSTLSLVGMSITDDPTNPRKFVFTSGSIAPGGYLVLYGDSASGPGEIHVRFNLRGGGEGVWLYNTTGSGGGLVDSVAFGQQVPDLSIGRLAGGNWGLTRPSFGAANVAQRTGDASSLRLNEWLTDGVVPVGDDFVELHNGDVLPVSLDGLALTDHLGGAPSRSPFAPLSFAAGAGWVYFIADGGEDPDHAAFKLSADGGQLALYHTADRRAVDRAVYASQRTGVSQGRTPDGGAGISTFPTPTPGASNVQAAPSDLALRVTEIMYHPAPPRPGGEYVDKDFEYLELQNTGAAPISLNGVEFTVGVTFVFPDLILQPGQYVIVVENRAAFESLYGTGRPVIGEYNGDLDDGGERLRLEDGAGATVLDFAYGDDGWYPLTDGAGYSLVVNDPQAAASTWGLPQSWHAGNTPGGTPGAVDGAPVAAVLGRRVFYNRSAFDGNDPGVTTADDVAVANDKVALLPGETSTFANFTSYSRGLNGIFLDFRNFTGTPDLSDFLFRVGTVGSPSSWRTAPAPVLTLRRGAGVGGSDRLAMTWADGAIRNTWLQVTVKAGGHTGLAAADVFYFGNLVGETGNNPVTSVVSATDLAAVRRRVSSMPVGITSAYDFNRDGRVTGADVLIARSNERLGTLPRLTAPAGAAAAPLSAEFGDSPIVGTAPRKRGSYSSATSLLGGA